MPVETRDGFSPSPADGAAHPDHPATDPAADPPSAKPPPSAGAPSHPRRRWLLRAGAAAALAVAGYLLVPAVETALNTVSTDDAYVNGYVTLVAPRVPGQVARVLVHDNYRVKKGDLLVQLDREPYQVQVDLKKAAVVNAEADLKAARGPGPGHPGAGRQPALETPEVDRRCRRLGGPAAGPGRGPAEQGSVLRSRRADLLRARSLFSRNALSREDFDQRLEAERTAEAAVKQALQEVYEARVALGLRRAPRRES